MVYICQIDTVEIKDIYLSVYKNKIADDIVENYDGVLQRVLLGLLNGNFVELTLLKKLLYPSNFCPHFS